MAIQRSFSDYNSLTKSIHTYLYKRHTHTLVFRIFFSNTRWQCKRILVDAIAQLKAYTHGNYLLALYINF